MSKTDAVTLVHERMFPAFKAERDRLDRIDRWYRWDHDKPHQPRQSTNEYKELQGRAQTPWGSLVVTSAAQAMYVEGYRQARQKDNSASWGYWQKNKLDARQIAVHRAALAYGYSFVSVTPGETMTGKPMPRMRGVSPRMMIAFWADAAEDDWPMFTLRAEPAKVGGDQGWALRLYDDTDVHYLQCSAGGDGLTWIENRAHNVGVCPFVRFANTLDLEGRADGEVEPFIPVLGRIDQTVFDRLVVQRFASWVVRTISGMSQPETAEATGETPAQAKLRLKVEDILIAEDKDTKFGSLPATSLDGFIAGMKADIQALAAVSQTPAHHLLGEISNLSAEALAAAESSLTRKVEERQHMFGESWEQVLRLGAHIMGDVAGADDDDSQVRWRDMESRSLTSAADALGKIATMLGVPVEMLWEKIPGWTDQDVERAKTLAAQGGSIEQLMAKLLDGQTDPAPAAA